MARIEVVSGEVPPPLKKKELKILAEAAAFVLNQEGRRKGKLTIVVTGDEEIARLNARFKGSESPTDVLAFYSGEGDGFVSAPEARNYLGDVVISWQRAEEQARDLGHSLLDELIILTIHGVLHLLGYQDEEERERERMWARQEELRQLFLTKEGP